MAFSLFKSEYIAAVDEFVPLDGKILADKLKLSERGKLRGEANVPATSSEIMDEAEQEIVTYVRNYASSDYTRLEDQLSLYSERLKSTDADGAASSMKALARQSQASFEAKVTTIRGDLIQGRQEVFEREEALNSFKIKNRLEHPAAPPKHHFMYVAVLFVLFTLEVFPNAQMLSEGSMDGMVGGFMLSMLFTFVSMATAFTAGIFGLTRIHHNQIGWKIIGGVSTLLLLAIAFAVNLLIAHYRSSVEAGMDTVVAAKNVISLMKNSPFLIEDVKSLIMVGVGVVFAVIAMVDGYLWSDPYPGYSRVTNNLKKAQSHYNDLIMEKVEELDELNEYFVDQIKAARSSLRDKRQMIPRLVEERKRLVKKFETHIGQLQDTCRYMLSVYRDANCMTREHAAPSRFNDLWKIEGFDKIEIQIENPNNYVDEFKDADEALLQSIDKLQSSFEESIRWIKNLNPILDVTISNVKVVNASVDEGEEIAKAA